MKRDNTSILKGTDRIPVFLFGDCTYPLLLFIMKEFAGGRNVQEKRFSAINGLVHVSQLRIHLIHWMSVLDDYDVPWILIKTPFPQILYLCLTLRNYFELKKEKISEQSLEKQSFEKRVQSATSNLSFKRFLSKKKVTIVP